MHERPYRAITVQQVLARARVGRATFYAHFSGKDDLLLGDADDFFALMAGRLSETRETSRRLAPVRELFAHAAEMGAFRAALAESGKLADVLALGRGHLARGIARRLSELEPTLAARQRTPLAESLAGALMALFDAWLARGTPFTAEEADEFFHALAWQGARGFARR